MFFPLYKIVLYFLKVRGIFPFFQGPIVDIDCMFFWCGMSTTNIIGAFCSYSYMSKRQWAERSTVNIGHDYMYLTVAGRF
jgi:hypothetical protein